MRSSVSSSASNRRRAPPFRNGSTATLLVESAVRTPSDRSDSFDTTETERGVELGTVGRETLGRNDQQENWEREAGEDRGHLGDGARSILAPSLHASKNEVGASGRKVAASDSRIGRRRGQTEDGDGRRHFALPRSLAGEELVEQRTERINVGARIDLPIFDLLRRHVGRRSEHHPHGAGGVADDLERAGNSEVGDNGQLAGALLGGGTLSGFRSRWTTPAASAARAQHKWRWRFPRRWRASTGRGRDGRPATRRR